MGKTWICKARERVFQAGPVEVKVGKQEVWVGWGMERNLVFYPIILVYKAKYV
jgi:hypothetical protein